MHVFSDTFADGAMMPDACAFGLHKEDGTMMFGQNMNPHLTWRGLPGRTRSLAVISDDLDVPADIETFNRPGAVVSRFQARRSLCHWVLVDLRPEQDPIELGEFSQNVSIGGKSGPKAPRGTRQGLNDYTDWFRADPVMAGLYYGYDGPCPPHNDEIFHRYTFTIYALDTDRLDLNAQFDKQQVLEAMRGHVLASDSVMGLFSANRRLETARN